MIKCHDSYDIDDTNFTKEKCIDFFIMMLRKVRPNKFLFYRLYKVNSLSYYFMYFCKTTK